MVLHAVAADTILSDEEMVDPRWCPLQQRLGGERDARQGESGGQRPRLSFRMAMAGLAGPTARRSVPGRDAQAVRARGIPWRRVGQDRDRTGNGRHPARAQSPAVGQVAAAAGLLHRVALPKRPDRDRPRIPSASILRSPAKDSSSSPFGQRSYRRSRQPISREQECPLDPPNQLPGLTGRSG